MAGAYPGGDRSAAAGEKRTGGGGIGIEASFGMRRQGFSEGVVFVVGGGSVDEYGNLQEWARRNNGGDGGRGGQGGGHGGMGKRRVVYGATEVVNAGEFLTGELERLGEEIGGVGA